MSKKSISGQKNLVELGVDGRTSLDTEHFLLLCPSFAVLLRFNNKTFLLKFLHCYDNLSTEVLTQLLLYGDENLPNDVNRNILKLTLKFIQETGRLG